MLSENSKNYIQQISKNKENDLRSMINEVHSALESISTNMRTRIREDFFVNELLPFACGERGSDNDLSEFRKRFIDIVAHPNTSVDVISTEGVVLFTLPPLVNTNFIQPNLEGTDVSYGEIVKYGALLGNQTPYAQTNYIVSALGGKGDELVSQEDIYGTNENQSIWIQIFKRYGKTNALNKIISNGRGSADISSNSVTPAPVDELDYDFKDDD